MAILAKLQEFFRLLPEVIATTTAICDKWTARQKNVSQTAHYEKGAMVPVPFAPGDDANVCVILPYLLPIGSVTFSIWERKVTYYPGYNYGTFSIK